MPPDVASQAGTAATACPAVEIANPDYGFFRSPDSFCLGIRSPATDLRHFSPLTLDCRTGRKPGRMPNPLSRVSLFACFESRSQFQHGNSQQARFIQFGAVWHLPSHLASDAIVRLTGAHGLPLP